MHIVDLPKWLAGHRPPPSKVCSVDANGREQALAMGTHSNRWSRLANALASMNAECVKLYNASNELLDQTNIEYDTARVDAAAPAPRPDPVSIPILKDASDVNALVHALAQAFAHVVTSTTDSANKAHEASFKELREVNKIQADLIKSLRQQNEDSMAAREEAIEVREQEHEEKKNGDAMMQKLIDVAGPELFKKVTEKMFAGGASPPAPGSNGAPPVKE